MTTHRHQQFTSTLRRALQEILARGINDPRLKEALITITEVDCSPDLRQATVLVSIIPEKKQDLVVHGLNHAAAHLRRQVGDLTEFRQMPQLAFRADSSLKKQAEVYDALAKVAQEREQKERAAGAGTSPSDTTEDGEPEASA